MPFTPVSPKVDFVAQEYEVMRLWRETDAFARLRALRRPV